MMIQSSFLMTSEEYFPKDKITMMEGNDLATRCEM